METPKRTTFGMRTSLSRRPAAPPPTAVDTAAADGPAAHRRASPLDERASVGADVLRNGSKNSTLRGTKYGLV
jgi:hypothetical protein